MKNIIIPVMLAVMGAAAVAQESPQVIDKPVVCADRDRIVRELVGPKYQENPVWVGSQNSTGDRYSLFVNGQTGTWTLIQFDDRLACIIGDGEQSRNISPAPAI